MKFFEIDNFIPDVVNSQFDKLMKSKQESNITKIQSWNFKMARLVIAIMTGYHFLTQCVETVNAIKKQETKLIINCILNWSLWIMIVWLLCYCYKNKKAKPVYYRLMMNLFMVSMWLPSLDLAGKCQILDTQKNQIYQFNQNIFVLFS